MAKGDLKLRFDSSSLFRANTVSVVFLASTDFGRWGLKAGYKLTQQAAALCKADPVTFARRHGTRYVDVEHRGATVAAAVTLLSVSTEFKAAFDSDMSASGGWGPLSAGASLKFSQEAKKASKQERVTVEVNATGGSGFGALGGTVLSALGDQPLSAALNALSTFIGQFSATNAAVTKYHVRPMTDFGWDDTAIPPWTTTDERALARMATGYRLVSKYRDLSNMISNGTHPLARVLSKTALAWIAADVPLADEFLQEVTVQHSRCKQGQTYRIPSQPDMTVRHYLRLMDPPRVAIYVNAATSNQQVIPLTLEQGRVVLNARPEQRLAIAQSFDRSITEFSAMFQSEGAPYGLSLAGVFVKSTGEEYRVITESAWSDGYGLVWYDTRNTAGVEALELTLNKWMISAEGTWKGIFYFIIKDKLGRTSRLAFMEAEWVSDRKTLSNYQFNLIY